MLCFFSSFLASHGGDDPSSPEIFGPVTNDEVEQEERKHRPEEEKELKCLRIQHYRGRLKMRPDKVPC